ncbi:Uncharacterised protein [Salmonella enterica subsp. arizonae]|uniref:Uncharacterized protein n=1 Tax=Salmonella enterica subsp. arizonae TaxID=59203 RepID=A0A379SP69_SALER|nr:Uncharacterised protein [Salmonella enterica subsp. arizonae]
MLLTTMHYIFYVDVNSTIHFSTAGGCLSASSEHITTPPLIKRSLSGRVSLVDSCKN